jgi:hypothetical protein
LVVELWNEDNIDLFEKYSEDIVLEMLFVRIEYVNEIDKMLVHKNTRNLNNYSMKIVSIHRKYSYLDNVRK